jgi:hypothetical protein
VAFLGQSGQGKSTLAAACYLRGNGLVADDVLPIVLDGGAPTALPAFLREMTFRLDEVHAAFGGALPASGLSAAQVDQLAKTLALGVGKGLALGDVAAARATLLRDIAAPLQRLPADAAKIAAASSRGRQVARRLEELGGTLCATGPAKRKRLGSRLARLRARIERGSRRRSSTAPRSPTTWRKRTSSRGSRWTRARRISRCAPARR